MGSRILAIIIVLLLPLSGALAQSRRVETPAFTEARAAYFKLRNTDPSIARLKDWEAAAKALGKVADATPHRWESAEALFHRAVIEEHLARAGRLRIETALATLEQVVKRYPESEWADDALLRSGDLYRLEMGDTKAAKAVYQDVITRFGTSDSAQAAELKLMALERGGATVMPLAGVRPSAAKKPSWGSRRTVVLDPGHGGEDVGGRGIGGLLEKDVTLSIAFEVERLLQERLGARVVLTRRADEFIPLAERTEVANAAGADVFVSIHTNASPEANLQGLQTFYLDTTNDEASRLLAERENQSLHLEGQDMDLAFILSDLTQHAKLGPSIELSFDVHRAILKRINSRWGKVKDLGVRKAPFYVLVGARMPCILAELFFIDHPVDGTYLADSDFRSALAEGMYSGIHAFLSRVEAE